MSSDEVRQSGKRTAEQAGLQGTTEDGSTTVEEELDASALLLSEVLASDDQCQLTVIF